MRFQYDAITDNSYKFNDLFEFYEHINLDAYLQTANENQPADYTLHAVLVHSGDNHSGHYVVYINPSGDGKWCKFDDDVVSRCTKTEAIDYNYGGIDDDLSFNAKLCANAYMLVYIRDAAMSTVLQQIEPSEIPEELTERLRDDERIELIRRQERAEANAFMTVNVLLEEFLESNQIVDFSDAEKVHGRLFKVRRILTMAELMKMFADTLKVSVDRMRVWPLEQRCNQMIRPTCFDAHEDINKTVEHCALMHNPWIVYLEVLLPDSPLKQLPSFDKEQDMLLFFKVYDPTQNRLNYCGQGYCNVKQRVADLVAEMCERVGWPTDTELTVYKELGPTAVQKIQNHSDTLYETSAWDIPQVDVIIFERKRLDANLVLPTCEDYFNDLLYRINVTFIDRSNLSESGFVLQLSLLSSYDQMATAVAQKINEDPLTIQFFKCQK